MFLIPKDTWQLRKTSDRGRGIFAKSDIPGGTVLGDYIGVLSTTQQIERRERKLGALYSMYRDESLSIWPNPKKPGVHLVNHSCMPNSQFTPYKGHMLLVAVRRIFRGEEITAAYDVTTPSKGDEALPCFCNTLLCRGTLTASAIKLDQIFAVQMTPDYYAAQKREKLKLGDVIPLLPRYPKSLPDHPLYDIFANPQHLPVICTENGIPRRAQLRAMIRESGCALNYPAVGLTVHGVLHNRILADVQDTFTNTKRIARRLVRVANRYKD